MNLEKRIHLAEPVDEVWALVGDVTSLGRCIPGLESLTMQDETHFDSVVRMKLGPLGARFALRSVIEEVEPPRRLVMSTEGVDRSLAGRVRQRQVFELAPGADGGTDVRITSDIAISGRFATFGQRLIAAKADEFSDEVAANVTRLLAERRSGRPA